MITARCANCGFSKDFDNAHRGRTFRCPTCSSPVKIMEPVGESSPVEFLNEEQQGVGIPETSPPPTQETFPETPAPAAQETFPEISAPAAKEPHSDIPVSPQDKQSNHQPSGLNWKRLGIGAAALVLILAGYFILTQFKGGDTGRVVVELVPLRSDEGYLYMDLKGQIAINPQFGKASVFREGLALVQSSDEERLWGYIDTKGNYKINPGYQQATVFNDGVAWVVSKGGAPTAIGTSGETLFEMKEAERVSLFREGLAAFSVLDSIGQKWGFVDKAGKVVIVPQFDAVGYFSEGLCSFMDGEGNWGYMDESGRIIINAQFEEAMTFSGGRAVVKSGTDFGLIDQSGKLVVNPQFDEMKADGDWYLIRMEGKYGWADEDGRLVINPQFDKAGPFAGAELAPVRTDREWGYTDKKGTLVINPQFDDALCFNGELAMVGSGRSLGFINSEGRYVINPQKYKPGEDFVRYVIFGDTEYGQVETDFIDIAPLVERLQSEINDKSINGLNFSSNYSQILQKFSLPAGHFTKTYNEQIVSSVKINPSVGITFLVQGYPFKQVAQSNGFYIEYSEVFDPDALPNSFAYEIALSGKYQQKKEMVMEAIQNAFPAFRKEINSYDKTSVTLYGETFTYTISYYGPGVRIYTYSPFMEIGD